MISTTPVTDPSLNTVLGIAIQPDGHIETVKQGSFDAGQADEIARRLVLLAASIRATARQRLFDSDQ